FERAAVRERMAHARVSRDPLRELDALREGKRLEQLLGALVHEAEPRLEIHDRLAFDAEAEVAGLDDAGVHRPHRDLEDAFAFDPPERKRLALVVKVRAGDDIAAERVIIRGPELVEREPAEIGM